MKTNKTVSLEITVNQYNHLSELARLVETVTEQPATAESVAEKLFARALTGYTIGLSGSNKSVVEEQTEGTEFSDESDGHDLDGEIEHEIATDPVSISTIEKSSQRAEVAIEPIAIHSSDSPIVKIPPVPTQTVNGEWKKLWDVLSMGCTVAIVGFERADVTFAALSICSELNRKISALYVAPDLVGDFYELCSRFGIDADPRGKTTKIIHYCPQNAGEWKRLLVDDQRATAKYDVIVTDTALGLGLHEQPELKVPFVAQTAATCGMVNISTFIMEQDCSNEEEIQTQLRKADVHIHIEMNGTVFIVNNEKLQGTSKR